MPNKIEKTDTTVVRPSKPGTFNPTFTVERVEGRRRGGQEIVAAKLRPAGGGADAVGTIELRMQMDLNPGTALNAFTILVGQDPSKGLDLTAAKGARVAIQFTRAT